MILYRPTGLIEFNLTKESNFTEFPLRLPEQPFFYPVLNMKYALQISEWNYSSCNFASIFQFEILDKYIEIFSIENVGDKLHNELWIPSEELENFNKNIINNIKIIYIKRKIDFGYILEYTEEIEHCLNKDELEIGCKIQSI